MLCIQADVPETTRATAVTPTSQDHALSRQAQSRHFQVLLEFGKSAGVGRTPSAAAFSRDERFGPDWGDAKSLEECAEESDLAALIGHRSV